MTENNTNKGGYKSKGKYKKPYPPLQLFTVQLVLCTFTLIHFYEPSKETTPQDAHGGLVVQVS